MSIKLIVGRTASGKDWYVKKHGLKAVKSRTTRPKRSKEDDSHIFVSQEEANSIDDSLKIAQTFINGYEYYVLKEDLEGKDAYIIDPNGIEYLLNKVPDLDYEIIYVKAKYETRKQRYLNRSNATLEEFLLREDSERQQFDDFEEKLVKCGNKLATVINT